MLIEKKIIIMQALFLGGPDDSSPDPEECRCRVEKDSVQYQQLRDKQTVRRGTNDHGQSKHWLYLLYAQEVLTQFI